MAGGIARELSPIHQDIEERIPEGESGSRLTGTGVDESPVGNDFPVGCVKPGRFSVKPLYSLHTPSFPTPM